MKLQSSVISFQQYHMCEGSIITEYQILREVEPGQVIFTMDDVLSESNCQHGVNFSSHFILKLFHYFILGKREMIKRVVKMNYLKTLIIKLFLRIVRQMKVLITTTDNQPSCYLIILYSVVSFLQWHWTEIKNLSLNYKF